MAWAWKITYKWKVVTFSNDFPAEVNNKLREYKDMKKMGETGLLPDTILCQDKDLHGKQTMHL